MQTRWAVAVAALILSGLTIGCGDGGSSPETSVAVPGDSTANSGEAAAEPSHGAVEVDDGAARLSSENTSVVIRSVAARPDAAGAWRASFGDLSGQLQVDGDQVTALTVEFDTTSIQGADADLNNRLSSAEFLNTAEFPTGRFSATRFESSGKAEGPGDVVHVTGDLTLAGQTQEITAPAVVQIGDGSVAVSISMQVDRDAFGLAPYQEDVENTFEMAIAIGQQEKLQ